jgi:hypothetical protein
LSMSRPPVMGIDSTLFYGISDFFAVLMSE